MKTQLKKFAAVTLSAAMMILSFSVLADEDTQSVSERLNIFQDTEAIEVLSSDETVLTQEETETIAESEINEETDENVIPNTDISNPAALDEQIELFSSTVASGKCGDNLTWTLDSDGTLTISGSGDMYTYTSKEIDGEYITTAPWEEYIDDLRRLVLNDGITSIGSYAFWKCSGLTGSLVIPDGVTSIGNAAFAYCRGLTGNLVIPDSVTSIGNQAFDNCSGLTGNLVIPDGVTSIGSFAFSDCSGLTGNLVIPDSVTNINYGAFYGCSGLTGDLVIPDSVTSIGSQTFKDCSGLTGNLVIPDSVTTIDWNAFNNCSGLTGNLVIPDSVTSIGNQAFCGCSGLTGNLVIPDGVTTIGDQTFKDCSGLTGNLVIPDSVTSIGSSAFSGCSGLTGNLVIPDGVMTIGNQAFFACRGLTGNLVIPDSVTSIGSWAFCGCRGLTGNLVIPDGVTTIGEYTFSDCSGLTGNLVIPDGMTTIGRIAFYGCSGLTGNLVIPDSVTSIGNQAFDNCNNLTDMYIPRSEDSISTGGFPNRVHWKYDLSKCTAAISDQTFTGNTIIPSEDSITVKSPNGRTLYYGTDYVIESASNNINPGTATAHIAPPSGGISMLSQDVPFEIVGIDISGAAVTFPDNIPYMGEPCCPEPTVTLDGKTLVKGTDYTITYSNNNGEGTGTATITGIGSYIGSVTAEFEIGPYDPKNNHSPIDMSLVNVSTIENCTYDGTAHMPKPALTYSVADNYVYTLIEGTDYTLTYENNINAGTATIILTGIKQGEGGFTGTNEIDFTISPCEMSETTIADIPSYEYCKADICPEPEIKIGDVVLIKDVDYTLSYENNLNRGTATVTITGTGNLTGTVTKNFEITPRDGSRFTYYIILF